MAVNDPVTTAGVPVDNTSTGAVVTKPEGTVTIPYLPAPKEIDDAYPITAEPAVIQPFVGEVYP